MHSMSRIHSRLTAQGQISIPAVVRRRLGIGPGSVLEWEERDGEFVVRRHGRCSSADIHRQIFGEHTAPAGADQDVKAGIRRYVRKRRARS
jgi:AbrB family looped-hinge helix DNA binding protein